jgi:ATP-binding cassette, subfamily G (WHITE), member 2, SNQ2
MMAIIVGSVYYQLTLSTPGAFSRGGVIFYALLFNSLSAVSELPKIMNGRAILYKHMDFALYR